MLVIVTDRSQKLAEFFFDRVIGQKKIVFGHNFSEHLKKSAVKIFKI